MSLLVRVVVGAHVFAASFVTLVLGYNKAEPVETATGGSVRALGAVAADYTPLPIEVPKYLLSTEALAVEAVRDFFESQNCALRSVKCLRRMGADYCSVCLDHLVEPRNMLAATLVRCRGDVCNRADDVGESQRVDWNAEWACGFQFVGHNEWNVQ